MIWFLQTMKINYYLYATNCESLCRLPNNSSRVVVKDIRKRETGFIIYAAAIYLFYRHLHSNANNV